jgi:hypothetical protein
MSGYNVGPTFNSPTIVNTTQQPTRLNKNSASSSFEQTLKAETNRLDQKNNAKIQANTHQLKGARNNASHQTSKNFLAASNTTQTNGTNLALKELSTELAEQVVGILFNFAMNPDGMLESGFAETVYSQEANSEKVKDAAKDLIDDLSEQFYEDSLRVHNSSNNNESITQEIRKE